MKRFSGSVGIDQGCKVLFSDFDNNGVMWAGQGSREVRHSQTFGEPFASLPAVMVGISMWDMDHATNSRIDITAENVTPTGFQIVFRTWGDTRVARVRAEWTAIGAVRDEESWVVA